MLYTYGIRLGIKLLLRGKLKSALKHLIIPVNYWRTVEYKLVCNEANFQSNDRILDIGSPKLLSLYLARNVGAEVFSTDIEDYFLKECDFLRKIENISTEKYHVSIEDGRKLSFEDSYFTKVYSISVIEHIPERGDTECAVEIGRVLKRGGRCIITVPFSPQYKEEFRDSNFYWAKSSHNDNKGEFFYQRRYSEKELFERIINPSKLKLVKLQYIGENIFKNSKKELSDLLPKITGPIQPILSKLFLSTTCNSWKDLKKPLCALIVLEK